MKRGTLTRDVRLAYVDFGGEGPGLLLLHGLMGRATTWAETASWLTPHFHVIGLDQRGHGLSDKPDNAYTRDDYVNDAAAVIEALGLAPAVVIGHSMGALNAWVLAARRPELVRAIVLEDKGANTFTPQGRAEWQEWFSTWPVPFPTLADVRRFFGGQRASWADYFMEVVTEEPDGYHMLFSYDHMLQTLDNVQAHWEDLEGVQCPALLIKGEESELPVPQAQEMVRRMPQGRYAEVAKAGHVVHYDQPAAWRSVVEPFVLGVKACA